MTVSTRHAEIRIKDDHYVLVDVASVNGTQVNGKGLIPHRPKTLADGDSISIGNFRLGFKVGAPMGPVEDRNAAHHQAREMLARILSRTGELSNSLVLAVVSGPCQDTRFNIPQGASGLILGRGAKADLLIRDRDVSNEHAEIDVANDGITIKDLRSLNGTYVGEARIDSAHIEIGKTFVVGNSALTLEHPAEYALGSIFEAPEEETSSFSIGEDTKQIDDSDQAAPNGENFATEEPTINAAENQPEHPSLPVVGPADPLIAPIEPKENPRESNSGQHPAANLDTDSDLGLIIVGTIILLLAVIGLIYLFST
jgi:pSer/pThr/pTyr-binding forkhead associated (FHA) protein